MSKTWSSWTDGVATTDLKAEQDFRFLSPRTTELVRDWLARSGLREGPLFPRMQCRRPRFLADAHLGALARRLRMLGFDTIWHNDLGDGPLARLAVVEHRILLTRDRRLLMRQEVTHGCYLRSGSSRTQLDELVRRLDLCAEIAPFTRCMACNGSLVAVDPAAVQSAVPPAVYRRHQEYWRCQGCGRLYWKGTHWEAMRREIEGICPSAPI